MHTTSFEPRFPGHWLIWDSPYTRGALWFQRDDFLRLQVIPGALTRVEQVAASSGMCDSQ